MTMKQHSRKSSFLLIFLVYLGALLVGILSYIIAIRHMEGTHAEFFALFIADAVATVFTWAWGLVYRNVSVYDPYWSVAPPVIYTAYVLMKGTLTLPVVLLLLAVWYWAIRLTANWAYTFKGLEHEDWRYTKYRTECHPFIFQSINFFGLNMMPTIVVFLAMVPGLDIIAAPACSNLMVLLLGFAMSAAAATIQLVADTQSQRFRAAHPGEVCNAGLWKHGRHPNYFGEILMWWGVYVMFLGAEGLNGHAAWFIAGPVAITLLFRFISVPLMESRQLKRKPAYAQYKKSTRMFI